MGILSIFGKRKPAPPPVAKLRTAADRLADVKRLEDVARRAIAERLHRDIWREAEKAAKNGKYVLGVQQNIWPHETDAMPLVAEMLQKDGFKVEIKRIDVPSRSDPVSTYLIKYEIEIDWRVSAALGVSND